MGHPYAEHRQTKKEHSRVGHITKGYKSGGAVHGAKAIGKKSLSLHKQEHAELHAEGDKSKHRMDRPKRAKGGKVKGKHNEKTVINVISGGHPAGGAIPSGPPMAPPGPPMGIAPAAAMPPPMVAKPPMMPPGAGAPPPGPPMPMRAKGGKVRHREDGGRTRLAGDVVDFPITMQESDARRVSGMKNPAPSRGPAPSPLKGPGAAANGGRIERAKGGKVTKGTKVFEEGQRNGTPVQHMRGKGDLEQMGRGKQVTFESGGRVRSFYAKGGSVKNHTDPGASDRLHMGERFKASPMEIRGQDSNTTNDPTIGKPNRARGGMCRANGGMADKVASATKLPGGSGGGEARLAKAHREARR
jgi:hypothetical protein